VTRAQDAGHEVAACAVLVGDAMPEWSVDEILAVHFRMHKAEGLLFQDALVRAAATCSLRLVTVPTGQLAEHAGTVLGARGPRVTVLRIIRSACPSPSKSSIPTPTQCRSFGIVVIGSRRNTSLPSIWNWNVRPSTWLRTTMSARQSALTSPRPSTFQRPSVSS